MLTKVVFALTCECFLNPLNKTYFFNVADKKQQSWISENRNGKDNDKIPGFEFTDNYGSVSA